MYYIPRRLFGLASIAQTNTQTTTPKPTPTHPEPPKFCKDCKYFALPPNTNVRDGFCRKFGRLNLVDGSFEIGPASVARANQCKGAAFEERELQNLFDIDKY